MKKLIYAVVCLFFGINIYAQQNVIGNVTDLANNPLANIEVSVKGSNVKTTTDNNGNFTIELPQGTKFLIFKATNYATIEIEVNSTIVDVKMTRTDLSIFDLSLEELMNIEVVSSSKSEQNIRYAPNIISVVPFQRLLEYEYQSINEVLYHQAGFYPAQDYERSIVGSRGNFEGWNNNHLYLLIDGVPFNDNLYGTAYTWEITPLVFTKNMEIIKGPGAALYGSNATNGVITLNTFSAEDFENQNGFISFKYGSLNTHKLDFISGSSFKKFDAVFSFTNYSTIGNEYQSYDGSFQTDTNGNILKLKVNDNRQSNYIFTKITGKGSLDGFSIQYHKQMWNFQTGHGWLWNISDFDEPMKENRDIFVIKYNDKYGKIKQEHLIRYQNHSIDWNMRYYRQGSFNNFYPSGAIEYLKTNAQDVFARFQLLFNFKKNAFFVGGIEPSIFFYNGDQEHYANFDINNEHNSDWQPNALGRFLKVGHWFEPIANKPVTNIGSFVHVDLGDLISNYFKMTIGARYDFQFFNYIDIADNNIVKNKTFQQFSPRLAFIILPSDEFNIKLMAGTAFRAPTPTEMFGSNTWTLASNIKELKPEIVKTLEVAFDYMISRRLNFKINAFYLDYENQIAYSVANYNLSTNIFTTSNLGVEGEILFDFNKISGYFNASFYKRLNETIFEPEQIYVSQHNDKITWAPYHTSNMGIVYKTKLFNFVANGHFQSKVFRRDLDQYAENDLTYYGFDSQPRNNTVNSYFLLDLKIEYKTKYANFSVNANNILNSDIYLCKNMKYPFDYKQQGRTLYGTIKILL